MTFAIVEKSECIHLEGKKKDEYITLIYQFFLPSRQKRLKEIQQTLNNNIKNKWIDKIYLLNERKFTDRELGTKIDNKRVEQIIVNNRLKFNTAFDFISKKKIKGYIVLCNADIFFDRTIEKLKYSTLDEFKSLVGLLRYEANSSQIKLFGPRFDSQDTWILHSNNLLEDKYLPNFDFHFGTPGCDNKILYLFKILGFDIINDPKTIRTYHLHNDTTRNYNMQRLSPPFCFVYPVFINPLENIQALSAKSIEKSNNLQTFSFDNDNTRLINYISEKLKTNKNFIIPRIAGIENTYSFIGYSMIVRNLNNSEKNFIVNNINIMKKHSGIKFTDMDSIKLYASDYLRSFKNCEIYSGWEPWGNVYKTIQNSHDFIVDTFKTRDIIGAFCYDIFNYIHTKPWTHSLKGKRILIISAFAETMNKQLPHLSKIYGIDLFPDCELLFMKPPQTQGSEKSEMYKIEINKFNKKLLGLIDAFDVALVSAGGYGNLICNFIYENNKSAIYVGGVLQMYFGILGSRWKKERKEIIDIYQNKFWTTPLDTEKPSNHQTIENSCYW